MSVQPVNHSVGRSHSFIKQLLWLGASEGVARITRLLTAIVLSRYLSPFEFGVAAIVLSADELIRVLSRNGIGLTIIQADSSELEATCATVYKLNWFICLTLAIMQFSIAGLVAKYFSYPELAPLLQTLALTYLIYPFSAVHVYRIQRQQNMRVTGSIYGLQIGVDNILTAILVLMGMGVWAVVLPKLIVAPIWVLAYRYIENWRYRTVSRSAPHSSILRFSRDVLGVEILRTARFTWDRLIIGALLGVETLGVYYFAVNAGSGLAQSLIKAYNIALMPRLCDLKRQKNTNTNRSLLSDYRYAFINYAKFIVPLLLLQIALAPFYVPIVFGGAWVGSVATVMLLCVAMIFQGTLEIISPICRAHNQTYSELRMNFYALTLVLIAIVIGCQFNLRVTAIAIIFAQIMAWIIALRQLLMIADSSTNVASKTFVKAGI